MNNENKNRMEKISKDYLNPAFILEKKMKDESALINDFISNFRKENEK